MKKVILLCFSLSMLVLGCNKKSTEVGTSPSEPDPNEKNWYVFKHKTNDVCPDPHYGKYIVGANNYKIVCGPVTKKEADDCYNKNCLSKNK